MLRTSFLIFLYHGGNECQINVHIDMNVYLSDTYLEYLNFNDLQACKIDMYILSVSILFKPQYIYIF